MEGSEPEGMMSYRTEEEFLLVCGGQGLSRGAGGGQWLEAWNKALPSTSDARPEVNDHLQRVVFDTPSNFPC